MNYLFSGSKKLFTEYFVNKSLPIKKQRIFFLVTFAIAIVFRLLIFLNTNVFNFSDFTVYYTAAFNIASGQTLPIFISNAGTLTISHAAAWMINNLGSINYWFYANILVSCFTILIIWQITKKITKHNGIANLTVSILAFYTAFAVQTSVFYTQIIMIFLVSCILLFLINAFNEKMLVKMVFYILVASVLCIFTLFFKMELLYFYIFIGLSSVYFYLSKHRKQALVSLLFCVLSYVLFQLSIQIYEPIRSITVDMRNDVMFYGHTLYGGGEGVLLDEYTEKYISGLKEFISQHGNEYDDYLSAKNAYHRMLVKEFIINHPFQWTGLQAKKFLRTLGVKPEGISFRVLVSGKFGLNKILSGLLLTVPFVLTFLSCLFLFDWGIMKKLLGSSTGILMATAFIYYLMATIFYPHYQIRYRLPLEVLFLIPAAATFIVAAYSKGNTLMAVLRKHLVWKLIVFAIFVSAWAYEVYDIFYLNRDRYIINAEQYEKGIVP